ncbi:competence protein ComK [Staphylococcus sp. GSSP0090]|nr:competence protein ComK [Staphylococcus sp. GSSP0090]
MNNLAKLLFFKTVIGPELLTICQYTTHQFTYPTSINQTLKYILESNHLSLSIQLKQAKTLLKIRKLIPIYINRHTIIFPIKAKRSPIQYFINALAINGLKSHGTQTIIYFDNATFITVDVAYVVVHKKWQESLTLSHLIDQ